MLTFKIRLDCVTALFFASMIMVPTIASAVPVQANHGSVDLVAGEDSIQAGHSIQLGLLFKLEEGWHIYWQNPGDSGEPPRIEWKLPAGFGAGAIQWPIPMRLGKPPIVDYGYEEQVLLVVPVRVANNVRVGTEAALIVHVKWLVCREICIPEKADLALHLPVHSSAEKNLGAAQLLFAETSNCLPKPLPDGWKIAAVSSRESFVLTLQTGARVSGASFFPIEPNQIDNSAPQKVDPNDRGIRLTLVKSEQLLKPVASLKGVLVLGQGRAYLVSVPVR